MNVLREFPDENRCELVIPQCRCGRYMVRDQIAGKIGSGNNTIKRFGREYLDPLTMSANVTMFRMTFRCKAHPTYWVKIPMEEIVKMNEYPAANIKLVDRHGNEI